MTYVYMLYMIYMISKWYAWSLCCLWGILTISVIYDICLYVIYDIYIRGALPVFWSMLTLRLVSSTAELHGCVWFDCHDHWSSSWVPSLLCDGVVCLVVFDAALDLFDFLVVISGPVMTSCQWPVLQVHLVLRMLLHWPLMSPWRSTRLLQLCPWATLCRRSVRPLLLVLPRPLTMLWGLVPCRTCSRSLWLLVVRSCLEIPRRDQHPRSLKSRVAL